MGQSKCSDQVRHGLHRRPGASAGVLGAVGPVEPGPPPGCAARRPPSAPTSSTGRCRPPGAGSAHAAAACSALSSPPATCRSSLGVVLEVAARRGRSRAGGARGARGSRRRSAKTSPSTPTMLERRHAAAAEEARVGSRRSVVAVDAVDGSRRPGWRRGRPRPGRATGRRRGRAGSAGSGRAPACATSSQVLASAPRRSSSASSPSARWCRRRARRRTSRGRAAATC